MGRHRSEQLRATASSLGEKVAAQPPDEGAAGATAGSPVRTADALNRFAPRTCPLPEGEGQRRGFSLQGQAGRVRRTRLATLLVLCVALSGRAVHAQDDAGANDLGTRRTGDDWPAFLGPTGDSRSRETGIRTQWENGGLPIVWHAPNGVGYAMPAIRRGRLVQFDRFDDVNRVTCRNAETGAELWTYEYPTRYADLYGYNNGPRCAPVIDGERVYVFGQEGMLLCLRVTDGEFLWRVDTPEKYGVVQNFFGVGSTPLVEGDLLIVQVGGSPPESRRIAPGRLDQVLGLDSGVVAFDKFSGEEVYRLSDELASYSSPVCATVDGRRLCFVFARGGLLAFDPATGKQEFHFPWRAEMLESVNASNPLVAGDRVLISETYGPGAALLQVLPRDYKVLWSDVDRRRDKSLQTHWNTPVLHEGYVYASSGRHEYNAELRCIELETGQVMWRQPGLSRSSLLYVDGHFVCMCEDGTLLLIEANPEQFKVTSVADLRDPASGKPLLDYPCWAAPALAHGLMYVRGESNLVCVELIPLKP